VSTIVATIVYVPLTALFAALSVFVFGVPLETFVTFNSTFAAPVGLVVWWLVLLVPAGIYSVLCARW
jgi:hypothetical protein